MSTVSIFFYGVLKSMDYAYIDSTGWPLLNVIKE